MLGLSLAEGGWLPDGVARAGVRVPLRERLREAEASGCERETDAHQALLVEAPFALAANAANLQHYEAPAAFFEPVLGPHHESSRAQWDAATSDLASPARVAQLGYPETVQRAWALYLAYCEGAFRERSNVTAQLAFEDGATRRGTLLGELALAPEEIA